jgi:hypothetical protein
MSRSPRKPTLLSIAKQAKKAGIEVARYELRPDGTVVIVPGKPESDSVAVGAINDLDRELEEFGAVHED